jgi:hypothetical protein
MSDETLRSGIEDSEPDACNRGSITSGVKNLDQNQAGRDALCNYSMKPLQMQQPASGGKWVRDSDSGFRSEDEDETGPWTETWFHVDLQAPVLHEPKLMDILEDIEAEADDHTPLKFRPFVAQLLDNLRQGLQRNLTEEMLLSDIPGSPPGLLSWVQDNWDVPMVFPVLSRRLRRSRESNSPEF